MLTSNGDSTQPCRSPCVTSNHSERSPSSVRTRAHMPSLADNCNRLGWYTEACERLPQQVSVNGVIRFLQVVEAHAQGDFPLSSELLQSVNGERHIHCRSRRTKSALFFGEDSPMSAVAAEAGRGDFQQYLTCMVNK